MTEVSKEERAPVTESLGGAASLGAQAQSKVKPDQDLGHSSAARPAFQLYVWIRWITGSYFERVPAGRVIRRCT